MAEQATLARPYAEAVFSLAKETKQLQQWGDYLSLLEQIVTAPDMLVLFSNPHMSTRNIAGLLQDICEEHQQLGEQANNLIKILADNQRLDIIPELAKQYDALKVIHEGALHVELISTYAVKAAQKKQIVDSLKERFGKEVDMNVEIDRELLGGWVIRAGDKVIDMSVRGRLDAMKAELRT